MFSLEKVAELLGHLWVVFVEDGDLLELLRTVVVVAAWVALVVDLAFIIKKLEGCSCELAASALIAAVSALALSYEESRSAI